MRPAAHHAQAELREGFSAKHLSGPRTKTGIEPIDRNAIGEMLLDDTPTLFEKRTHALVDRDPFAERNFLDAHRIERLAIEDQGRHASMTSAIRRRTGLSLATLPGSRLFEPPSIK